MRPSLRGGGGSRDNSPCWLCGVDNRSEGKPTPLLLVGDVDACNEEGNAQEPQDNERDHNASYNTSRTCTMPTH